MVANAVRNHAFFLSDEISRVANAHPKVLLLLSPSLRQWLHVQSAVRLCFFRLFCVGASSVRGQVHGNPLQPAELYMLTFLYQSSTKESSTHKQQAMLAICMLSQSFRRLWPLCPRASHIATEIVLNSSEIVWTRNSLQTQTPE